MMIKEWPKQKSQIEELKAEVKNRQEALQEQEEKLKKNWKGTMKFWVPYLIKEWLIGIVASSWLFFLCINLSACSMN